MSIYHILLLLVLLLLLSLSAICARLAFIVPASPLTRRKTAPFKGSKRACKVALFLGSGGHTTELLQLASALPPSRYSPSLYLISTNDRFSADKAAQLQSLLASSAPSDIRKEPKQEKGYSILSIPRARAVHQSFLSTPVSVLISFAFCVEHVVRRPLWAKWQCRADDDTRFADLVLMNGPGTCVPLVAAIYISRFLGLPSPHLIYIESFARVKSLSLTARIVRPFVDRFITQWPDQGRAGGPATGTDRGVGRGARADEKDRDEQSWLV